MFSDDVLRNLSMREWSSILLKMSPIILPSKKDMGSLKSLERKSEINEILMRVLKCNNIHLRIKSTAVRLTKSIICPANTR